VPDTAAAATDTATADPETDTATAVRAGDSTAEAAPGRPHKSMLAAAAIVGALLIAVPFLISNSGRATPAAKNLAAPGTILGNPTGGLVPGAFDSASPAPGSSAPHDPQKSTSGTGSNQAPAAGVSKSPAAPKSSPSATLTKSASSGKSTTQNPASNGTATNDEGAVAAVRIFSHASGRCIDVLDGNSADGTPLQIWDCGGVAWQYWQIRADGTIRTLGKCMTPSGGATADYTPVVLSACNGSAYQKFTLNGSSDLVNIQSGQCVDVKDKNTANGTRIQLYSCSGADNQKWDRL
jgi:hypothetical protein